MRIVTWNMGCGPTLSPYRRTHSEAWRYLTEELKPDIALVQEALLAAADMVAAAGSVVWSHDRKPDSGAGVFIKHGLEFIPREVHVEGSFIAVASTSIRGGVAEVASVHVGGPEYQRNLEFLRDWLVAEVVPDPPFVVGGDLNS